MPTWETPRLFAQDGGPRRPGRFALEHLGPHRVYLAGALLEAEAPLGDLEAGELPAVGEQADDAERDAAQDDARGDLGEHDDDGRGARELAEYGVPYGDDA